MKGVDFQAVVATGVSRWLPNIASVARIPNRHSGD
jgi:hypothetical protein